MKEQTKDFLLLEKLIPTSNESSGISAQTLQAITRVQNAKGAIFS